MDMTARRLLAQPRERLEKLSSDPDKFIELAAED
jgi:hypothetical protein